MSTDRATDHPTAFATTPEQRVRELRHEAVRRAIDWILLGFPDAAERVMSDCLVNQARISGIHLD